MSKKKGRLLLVKIGDGEASESFTTLCGLRSKTLTINNSEIDVTTADCDNPGGALWTEVLAGVKRVSVSGNGYIKTAENEARLNALALNPEPFANFQIVIPGLGMFAAEYFLSNVEYGGEQEDGETYSLSLGSNGAVAFTAETP